MSLHSLHYKWLGIKRRVVGYSLTSRLGRLVSHGKNFRHNHSIDQSATRFFGQPFSYSLDFIFLLLDVFAIGEIYETVTEWLKFRTRALSSKERQIVKTLFANGLDIDRIRIDERALVPYFMRIAYVGIYTINCAGKMSEDLFVHELIHLWQYEQCGSVYIPRALRAQRSAMGYNYGGTEALRKNAATWWVYNYEQQGDILADYWRAKNGRPTRWKNLVGTTVPYQPLVDQLRQKNIELT